MDKNSAWDNLSYERQKKYLDSHPGSKRKITKSQESGKGVNWQDLERKIVDKTKSIAQPPVAPKFDVEEVGKKLDTFNPGEPGRRNDFDREQHDTMHGEATVAFRHLGNWRVPLDEEDDGDYDWKEWVPGEHEKYLNKFKSWLTTQRWFDPNTMEPTLHTGEKNWSYFGIRPKK